jgi:hypothetical protein
MNLNNPKMIKITHHKIILIDGQKNSKPNINVLIEKWIPCDLLWAHKP